MKNLNQTISGCLKNRRLDQHDLYLHCYDMLLGVALRYFKSKEEAIEKVNTAFIKILEALPKYDVHRSFDPWVKKIVMNVCLDTLRSQKKLREVFVLNSSYEEEVVEYEGDLVWDWVDQEYLDHILAQLKPFERSVFLGVALDGFSHAEMAKIHGVSERTSKRALHAARVQLAAQIENKTLKKA